MSSISVQSTSTKPPQAQRTTALGTDSSTSGLSKAHNAGSLRESISSFPSQRSSNVANQMTTGSLRESISSFPSQRSSNVANQTTTGSLRESISSFPSQRSSNVAIQTTSSNRSSSQDNVPHPATTTSASRSSTSRFAGRTFFSKTNSSISGFFPGQPNQPVSEKSHLSSQPSTSEPVNVSYFVDKTKRWTDDVPTRPTLSSCDDLEIRSNKYSVENECSRIPSENLTCDRPGTVSHSGENSDSSGRNGKAEYAKKFADSMLNLTETRANNSIGGALDDKDLNLALKGTSSCSPCLFAIPFGSIPIDIVFGCRNSQDSSFLNRAAYVDTDRPCYLGNSTAVDGSPNCRPSNSESFISKSCSSTSSTSEGPDKARISSAALEPTGAYSKQPRVERTLSSVSNVSSCAQQVVGSRYRENIQRHDALLTNAASDCSSIDSTNPSSISNIHPSLSQKDVNRRKPLLHMTISSSSDVEFLFNRTPSETSTPSELSIVVVESPRSGTEIEAPTHVTGDDPGFASEQCRPIVDKLYPIVSSDAQANDLRAGAVSARDNQLSLEDPEKPIPDVSADYGSGVHRYSLRCQDRLVPSTSDPANRKMAYVCTIVQETCKATGENGEITCVIDGELESKTSQNELKSLRNVLEENRSSSDKVQCRPTVDKLYPIVSSDAQANDLRTGAISTRDNQLSIEDSEKRNPDVSASGVRRYSLQCQDRRLVPSTSNPATGKIAYVCTIVQEKCQAIEGNGEITCVIDGELESKTSLNELKSLHNVLEDKVQCRPTVDKLYQIISSDAQANDLRAGTFSTRDNQLSIEDLDKPSPDVSADYGSGFRRYSLRCQDRLVPSASDPATGKMAYVCTIVQETCQATGEHGDITCVIDGELESKTSQKEFKSLHNVLEEDRSSSDEVQCRPTVDKLYPIVSSDAQANDLRAGAFSARDNQLSIEDPDKPSPDVSGVRRYSLKCQDRLVPSASNPATGKIAYVCTIVQETCQAIGDSEDITCVTDGELESKTSQKESKSLHNVLEDKEQCRPTVDKLYPIVSSDAQANDLRTGAFSTRDNQLSIQDPDKPIPDVSADHGSGVRRYSLKCQDRLVPSATDPANLKMAYVCTIVQETCQATGENGEITCEIDGELESRASQKEFKSLQIVLGDDRSSSEKGPFSSSVSEVSHVSSASENADSRLNFIGTPPNPATLSDNRNCGSQSKSIPPSSSRSSLTKARAYFKGLCSRLRSHSTASAMLPDAQNPSTSVTPQKKSDHRSKSPIENNSRPQIKICFQSARYATDCSIKPPEAPTGFTSTKNNRTSSEDEISCCRNLPKNDFVRSVHRLEEKAGGAIITASQGITQAGKSSNSDIGESDRDSSSDGYVRLSDGPSDISATSASLLKLSLSGSDSNLVSAADRNVEEINTQTRVKDLLAERPDSTVLEKNAESQSCTCTPLFETPMDDNISGVLPPESSIEIVTNIRVSFQRPPSPHIRTEVTQSLSSQPILENRQSRENSMTNFPPNSEYISSDKVLENMEQPPAEEVRESFTKDRNQNEISSSTTQRKQTDSETFGHQASSTYDTDFKDDDDDPDDMTDTSAWNAQDERQRFPNEDRSSSFGYKKKQQQNYISDADNRSHSPSHSQRCQSQRFSDSPFRGEPSTGTRPRDRSTDFDNDLTFTQMFRGDSTYTRTHPKQNDLMQSVHSSNDLLHSGYDFHPASRKHAATCNEFSSDSIGSSTTLTIRSDEQDTRVAQIPTMERPVADNYDCKTKPRPRHTRKKNSRLHRKNTAAREYRSRIDNERLAEYKVSDYRVKSGIERNTIKYGCGKDVLVVTDDNLNSVSERKRGKKRKRQRITAASFSLRKFQRVGPVTDDDYGFLDVTAVSNDGRGGGGGGVGRGGGLKGMEDMTGKGKGSDSDSCAIENSRSSDSSLVQPGKKEQYSFSNGIHTATVREQQDPTSAILDYNDSSSTDYNPVGCVGFAIQSKHGVNDCFPEIESVMSSSIANQKLKKAGKRDRNKKTRQQLRKNDRVAKSKPDEDGYSRSDSIASIPDSNKAIHQEQSMDYHYRKKAIDNSLQYNTFLTAKDREKSQLGFCSEFEVKKSSTVHRSELQLNASTSKVNRLCNSDEAGSETELKDALYFDRLHEEFERLSAHQRKLDEFTLLGPECSAILRDLEARDLHEAKATNFPTTTYTRRNFQSSNDEPFVPVEEKTATDLFQKRFSESIDATKCEKRRSSLDATENMKICFPCEEICDNLTLEASKLERKDNGTTKGRKISRAKKRQQKFLTEPNCNCADLENGYMSLPSDKENRGQRRSDCPERTNAEGTHTVDWVNSNSYLQTWIERNFEPTANTDRATIKDTPSFKHPMVPTGGRRMVTFDCEVESEEGDRCSNLSSVMADPVNGRNRRDSRSTRNQKAKSQLRYEYGRPGERAKPCDQYRNPCDDHGKPCDEHDNPCDDHGKPCDEHDNPCNDYGKPCDVYGEPCVDYGKPCEYGKAFIHGSVRNKMTIHQSECGTPCDRSQYGMSGSAVAVVSTGTMTEATNIESHENQYERERKKQSNIRSILEAVTSISCDIDKDIPELPAVHTTSFINFEHTEDKHLEMLRHSNKPSIEDQQTLDESLSELIDDSKEKFDRKMSKEKPAQIEDDTSKKDYYEDKDKSRRSEDKDKSRGNEDKDKSRRSEVRDKNRRSEYLDGSRSNEDRPNIATDGDDYTADKIDVLSSTAIAEQLDQTDETKEKKGESKEQMKQKKSLKSKSRDHSEEGSDKFMGFNLIQLTGTDNLSSVYASDKPTETRADDSDFKDGKVDENDAVSEQQEYNDERLNSQVEDVPSNSLIRNRAVVPETMNADGSMSREKERTRTMVQRPQSTDMNMAAEPFSSPDQQHSDHIGRRRISPYYEASNAVTTDHTTANKVRLSAKQGGPRESGKKPLAPLNQMELFQKTLYDGTYSGNKDFILTRKHGYLVRKLVDQSRRHSSAFETSSGRVRSQVFNYGEPGNTHDDEASKVATTKPTTTNKVRLPAKQGSPTKKKSPLPLPRMELFQNMIYDGDKNLMLKRNQGQLDRRIEDESRRRSLLMALSRTSASPVDNHEEPSSTDVSNWGEEETPTDSLEHIVRVTDYGRQHTNAKVPTEKQTTDKEVGIWNPEAYDKIYRPHKSTKGNLKKMGTEKKELEPPDEKNAETSKEGRKHEDKNTEDFQTTEDHVVGVEPRTPEYATLKELDWVGSQLLRCRKESETLMKDKSQIQSKLLKLKKPHAPTGDAKKKSEELDEEEECEEEEEEKDCQQKDCSVRRYNDAKLPQYPLDLLIELRERLEQCQRDKESAQQQKKAAEAELDKMMQTLSDQTDQSPESKKRAIPTGDLDTEVKVDLAVEVKPTIVRRPFYYTMMRVTEADSCSRQFYGQVSSLLTRLREERSDRSCGDDDFKDRMLWTLWHQRQEAFRELGEWETHLRGMNIPAGTVRESLRQLQRQLDERIDEIKNHGNEISQLRMQKIKMQQTMSEHIRHLVDERRKHAALVKALMQRNEFLAAEVLSRKTMDESVTTPSQLRDAEEVQTLRAEIRRLVAHLKDKDDCSAQRCSVKALPVPRSRSDDMERTPENSGLHLQVESSSTKEKVADAILQRNVTKEDAGRRKSEEDLIKERSSLIREKIELEKKLKFRDDIIDRLTLKAKDRRGWPSFQLADSSGSTQMPAAEKLRKNPKWKDQCSPFKTPFSCRFNSEARFDHSERKRGEKLMIMNGGRSSPLLASDSPPPDRRICKQKQLRVMQSLNCGILTQRRLFIDDVRASSRLDGSSNDLSLVELDRDVEFEYEALVGQRHRKDLALTSSTALTSSNAGQLSEIAKRMEKLETLLSGQHLLLTFTRDRMTSLEDDNEFLRQQLAALRQRTCRQQETNRDNNWLGLIEELVKARKDNNA